jgi:hypothetical protein
MANFSFPLQFLRQYAGPLDYDGVFATTSARISYLTNARRYAGQIVTDLQDGNTYVLSSDTNSWINVNSKYLPLSGGVITNDLTVLGTFSAANTNNWQNTYSTVQSNSASWQSVYSNVQGSSASYVTLSSTQTLTNKTVINWITLVRGYKTAPTLLTTIGTGEVYSYVYTSSPSDKTYYRFVATDGSEDSFYASFNGTTLSNLVARKAITI